MFKTRITRTILRTASVGVLLLSAPAVAGVGAGACNCPGDLDNNGFVDGADLGMLLGAWGTANAGADINGSGLVDGADLGLLLGAWGPCAGPANDHCGSSQVIGLGTHPLCTEAADTDGPVLPDNSCGGATQIFGDVWFTYEALSTGDLTVTLCNAADFDSVIAVYGAALPGMSPCPTGGIGLASFVGCNDDSAGCGGLTSKVIVPVAAGHLYKIRVGGFSAFDHGSGTLTLSLSQPGESCEHPRNTSIALASQTVVGNTSDNPVTQYPSNCFNGTQYGPTEWIRWESTCWGVLQVSTCNDGTDFDTVLTVLRYEFDGSCWGSYITCNDDSAQPGCSIVNGGPNRKSYISRVVSPGEVLYFLVSGYDGAKGNYEMTIDLTCD